MGHLKEWNIHPDAVSEISKVMLEELIKRKEKLETLKKAKSHWSLFTLLSLGLFLLFGAKVLNMSTSLMAGNFLSLLVNNVILLTLIGLFSLGLIQVKFLAKKTDKADAEYEALRVECIERQSELWEGDVTYKSRESVFSYMRKSHDINLYYK